jgi:membrane protease YdiL (CAAX protease family)
MITETSFSDFIPYFLIALTIGSRFIFKNQEKLIGGLIGLSLLTCCFYSKIYLFGALILLILSILIFFFQKQNKNVFLFLGIFFLSLLIYIHLLPGFNNLLIVDEVQISKEAWPFTLYLNYNKPITALILSTVPGIFITKQSIFSKNVFKTIGIGLAIVLIAALSLNFIRVNPKVPSIFPLWVFNNLVFVCFAEEVLFRGFLQKNLTIYLNSSKWAIIISSTLFGFYHYAGGPLYIFLSALAGLFYGYAYHQTNRIETPILFHFILNLMHILFFTYPSLKY